MNRILSAFLHKLRFQRQLDITVALGIFLLALFSSLVGAWISNERMRNNLLEQGMQITESLARQSSLALLYASGENAAEAVNATLSFPGVLGAEIRDVGLHVLLQRNNPAAEGVDFPKGQYEGSGRNGKFTAVLESENRNAWRFSAPVYVLSPSSPFDDAKEPELLGHVVVVFSKAGLAQMTTGIFVANLIVSLSFALLIVLLARFLSGRVTRPLNQLASCMERAENGELEVRAELAGPQDISDMAHAFNSMMSVLEKHTEEIRQLNAELEQRVAQRTAQLEATNKELEEFSYSMSHDMRTPLRALDGFSKILQEEHGDSLDDEGKRLVKVLRDNAQRMGRLVDDILHYLGLGRRKVECATVDMNGLVQEVYAHVRKALPEERHMQVEVGVLPPAWGDPAMLREIWECLLSNAVKFTPGDAEVRVEINGQAGSGENIYSVQDRGVGFDMKYYDKLFRVFERVHPTGQYQGSGIGLAIVKRIVTRHGGRVWAQGKMNQGATFYFALPDKEKNDG